MKDFGKWAAYAIKTARLTEEEQADVEAYLDRILTKYDDLQMDYIWSQIGTCVYIATPNSSAARILQFTRKGGDIVRFNPSTDEFGVLGSDGTIHTYYRPNPQIHGKPTNLDYFYSQKG